MSTFCSSLLSVSGTHSDVDERQMMERPTSLDTDGACMENEGVISDGDALCSQHLECGSNCSHVLPMPRPLIRARTRTRTQAMRARQRCLSLFKTRKKKAMKYPSLTAILSPNHYTTTNFGRPCTQFRLMCIAHANQWA